MSYAGWLEIWHSTVALIARAPAFTQVMVWLGVAFAVVMCLEGLRVSFLPRRWLAPRMTRTPFVVPPKFDMPVVMAAVPSMGLSRSFELREKPLRVSSKPLLGLRTPRNRKKVISRVRRTRPIKPQIKRYPADLPQSAMELIPQDMTFESMQDASLQM